MEPQIETEPQIKMDPRECIKLSKGLSWLLRHHVVDQGLSITSDGYVLCLDVLKLQKFNKFTLENIQYVVNTNDKQRFALKEENGRWYIRANQGHSHGVASHIKQEELLTKLIDPLDLVVHGTTLKAYDQIKVSGLKKIGRSHIHFAISDNLVTGNQAQSGIRFSSRILIYLDMKSAMADGIEFYMSDNKVVLSEGIGSEGVIDPKYFSKVIDRTTGNILS